MYTTTTNNPYVINGKNTITSTSIGTATTITNNTNPSLIQPYTFIDTISPTVTIKGQLVLNGQDLEERLKTIEKLLLIPERDVTLEVKYPKLKEKYEDYIKTLSQYRTWESIKGKDHG